MQIYDSRVWLPRKFVELIHLTSFHVICIRRSTRHTTRFMLSTYLSATPFNQESKHLPQRRTCKFRQLGYINKSFVLLTYSFIISFITCDELDEDSTLTYQQGTPPAFVEWHPQNATTEASSVNSNSPERKERDELLMVHAVSVVLRRNCKAIYFQILLPVSDWYFSCDYLLLILFEYKSKPGRNK